MPHLGGQTSKLSQDLNNLKRQLKTKKTRGANPRDLEPSELTDLEQRRDALLAHKKEHAKQRVVNRINAHTTDAANDAADRVIESQRPTNDLVKDIASVVVDGKAPPRADGQTAQERLAQIRQITSSLNAEAMQLREENTNDRVAAAEDRETRMAEVQRARAERIGAKGPAAAGAPPRAKRAHRTESAPAAPSLEQ